MPKPLALSNDALKHWGLLGQPFSREFFFRSTPCKLLMQWLPTRIADSDRLQLVRSEIGSGIETAFEHIAACGGINGHALDVDWTRWNDQALGPLLHRATDRFILGRRNNIAPVWLIHAFRPSQVTALRHHLNRDRNLLAEVTTIIRIEDNPSTRLAFEDLVTHRFGRTETSELADAVGRSMRSAGATRAILDESAIGEIVRASRGSYSGLADATNRSLAWGHQQRRGIVTRKDVRECFAEEIEIRRSYRYAA